MKKMERFRRPAVAASIALGALLVAACDKATETSTGAAPVTQSAVSQTTAPSNEEVQLMHVHGLAYDADGSKLMIPSHHGLAVYNGSAWSKAPGPQHDYMGFSATKDAIYSSGHPAPGSGLVNPFGVIKSVDGGQTWQKLGLEGESDFHMLTTGYETNALYVGNPQPNSKMQQPGIYYTLNDGFTWQRSAARGLNADLNSLAVHPSNPKVVAVGTDNGLYLSNDAGNTFKRTGNGKILAAFFDLDGKHLWLSKVDGAPGLVRFALNNKSEEKIATPVAQNDAVAYVAQNPAKRNEYAIATLRRSVYLSQDKGKTWKQVADSGRTL